MTGLPLGYFSGPSTASCVASTLGVGCVPYLITCVSVDRPRRLGFLVCLVYQLAFLYVVDNVFLRPACAAAPHIQVTEDGD
jgi:hypothetical protein